MTQIITVTNQKGGVGKTTTAAALVSGLQQRGAKVLGIDLDPQGNLGFNLGLDIGSGSTVYDVLQGTCPIEQAIQSTEYGDILPSDIMLSAADVEFTMPRREFLLTDQLSGIRSQYDFIIIDTPPALNILTVNAYVASDGLIVPMEAEVLSLVGITQLQETIETVRSTYNPHLKVLGILVNKFNGRLTLSKDILGRGRSHGSRPRAERAHLSARLPSRPGFPGDCGRGGGGPFPPAQTVFQAEIYL